MRARSVYLCALHLTTALRSPRLVYGLRAMATANPPVQKPEEVVGVCTPESHAVVRAATRAEVREKNLPYRSSFVLVVDSRGERVVVQKRVAWKETYPSHLDPCPGGVMGPDETFEGNAARELAEEMGIEASEDALAPLFDFYFEDDAVRTWGRLLKCTWDGEIRDLSLQASEVESAEWVRVGDLRALLDGPVPTCPDSALALRRWLDEGGA